MTLTDSLHEYIAAAFSGIWIESHEHEDALAEIAELCRIEAWHLAIWDIEQGLRIAGAEAPPAESGNDPLAAVRSLGALAMEKSSALLVLVNFHRFLQSAEIVQALARQLASGKQNRTFVLVLSPIVQVPTELEKQFIVVEHPLPNREQLQTIARGVATSDGELPGGLELQVLELCRFSEMGAGLYREIVDSNRMSTRSMDRLAKVARTVADLNESDAVEPAHFEKAASFVLGTVLHEAF